MKPKKQGVMSVAYFCSFVILSSMMILNLFIGVITSSMADAKSDLSQELEDEQAAMREQETDEQMMTKLLHDLQAIMEEVSDEIADFSELERQRHDHAVIQLSGTDALNNKVWLLAGGRVRLRLRALKCTCVGCRRCTVVRQCNRTQQNCARRSCRPVYPLPHLRRTPARTTPPTSQPSPPTT